MLQSLDQEADTERVGAGGAQDEGQLLNAEADQTEEEEAAYRPTAAMEEAYPVNPGFAADEEHNT